MEWDTFLEKNDDMDSSSNESMEKFDDSFFDDFFDDSADNIQDDVITEDDMDGLIFDDTPNGDNSLVEDVSEVTLEDKTDVPSYAYEYDPDHSLEIGNYPQEENEDAKTLTLSKGDMSSNYKDIGTDEEGLKALNEFYLEIASEIIGNMERIHDDANLSPVEKMEKLSQESRRWEICKGQWEKDANGKK